MLLSNLKNYHDLMTTLVPPLYLIKFTFIFDLTLHAVLVAHKQSVTYFRLNKVCFEIDLDIVFLN